MQSISWLHRNGALLALGSVLGVSVLAKVISGYNDQSFMSPTVFWGVFVVEALALILIAQAGRRCRIAGCLTAIGLAVGGMAASWLLKGECGCLGKLLSLSAMEHRMLAGTVGLVATLALKTELASRAMSVNCAELVSR